jgi:hypothetical protein
MKKHLCFFVHLTAWAASLRWRLLEGKKPPFLPALHPLSPAEEEDV